MLKTQSNENITIWKPPLNYGLLNSEKSIPDYYLTGRCRRGTIFEIDYFSTIVDSIKNLRMLTENQLSYLKKNPEKNHEIIILYNETLQNTIEILNS